jgi:ribonuclease D
MIVSVRRRGILLVSYEYIKSSAELEDFLKELQGSSRIVFDTEFISEGRYVPELCLVQIATDDALALIDTVAIEDVSSLWKFVATVDSEIVMHAGRGDLEFCLRSCGLMPRRLFDTQVAAALIGPDYPAGFRTLVSRYLDINSPKGETRTDWRKRPLTKKQLQYALDDVRHLLPLQDRLMRSLRRRNRVGWLREEMNNWAATLEEAFFAERWSRVTGVAALSRRSQAIVREVWRWREGLAHDRNCPPKRILRDDLIVELAKRGSADMNQITAIRGLDRGDLRRRLPELASAIKAALDVPREECPQIERNSFPPQFTVMGQFMYAALNSLCRQRHVAASLVGTQNDVRELIAMHTGDLPEGVAPRLLDGWRAEVVGNTFEDLLSGRTSIRVGDPKSDHPLIISNHRSAE